MTPKTGAKALTFGKGSQQEEAERGEHAVGKLVRHVWSLCLQAAQDSAFILTAGRLYT